MLWNLLKKKCSCVYRFISKMINLRNKTCHTCGQPLKWGGGCHCNICLITTCLGPGRGVLFLKKMHLPVWLTLGREMREGMKASWILLSINSSHGFGGGGWQCCLGIITPDLQLARGRDGIVTFIIYCKHLASLRGIRSLSWN